MSNQIITRIGPCELPDGPPGEVRGYWQEATCADWSEAVRAHGGRENLSVWSSLTDLDGQYGSPFIFTCWGEKTPDGNPVAADGGHPDDRYRSGCEKCQRRCQMRHAVFVPVRPKEADKDG